MKKLFWLIFILGISIRLFDAWRPINRASWRECDLGAVSRNYLREGMNPFYPRIDWRGNTAGYAEMEFPIYPYLTAISYKIFGENEQQARLINFIFSIFALIFFLKLARSFLDEFNTLVAFAFFTFHPLIVELSTSIQPEGLMILCYLASIYFFTKWLKTEKKRDFWLATISTLLMILAKATSAHIGLLFGVLLLQKYGLKIFREKSVWIFGLFSLLPASIWYYHAKNLWKIYGNSLGVSNEYHWVGWDFFTNPYFIKGILGIEISAIWLYFGLIIAFFAIWKGWRENVAQFSLIWFVSIFAIYFIASRTTADEWATYYHVFSVPPAALLIGFGAKKLPEANKIIRFLLVISLVLTFLSEVKIVRSEILQHRVKDESFEFSKHIKPLMTKDGLILASGNPAFDADGYSVAYNASFIFYWLERKGFNIADEEQNIAKVNEFSQKGAKYFVAQKNKLELKPNFEAELRQNYKVVAECDEMILFDLTEK